ncbi:MAG: glycolate oxidase subunit GlcD [Methanomassiliicoccales archaeon PtaU1.Bin124]|nr:MAG: glycolate oxidase subunit GlcD [Methanomassiliicoccales archaeon PtaU1.Bin124]
MEAKEEKKASSQLIARLEDAIGHENVKTSKMERLLYSHDLAPLPNVTQVGFMNVPDVVVRPRSTEDVSKIVKIASEEGVPITPRGSSSWGLGGSMPCYGGILIDFAAAMNKITEIDPVNLTVTAGPGATWKAVYDACMEKGLLLCSYPSSFPSATLGGWISTGGIGMGSMKYGSAGDNIRDMEVVMSDGTILHTGTGKISNNMSGYDLNRLIVGSEGTLGLVCKVTLKLMPGPEIMKPIAYSFPNLQAAGAPILEIMRKRVDPLNISFADGKHFEMLRKIGKHAPEVGAMITITLEGAKEVVAYEEKVIEEIFIKAGAKRMDDAIAQHEWDERCYEFRVREIGLGNIPGEVIVPMDTFSTFTDRLYKLMDDLKMTGAIIGIIADRNTIMFMPYYLTDFDNLINLTSFGFNAKFNDLAYEFGGRPMGFGAFFAPNLDRVRGPGAKYIRQIKTTLDPKDIINPGKMVGMSIRGNIKISPVLYELGMGAMGVAKKMLPRDHLVEDKMEAYALERAQKERAEAVHQHPKDDKKH